MTIDWSRVTPVLISIGIIIAVAVLRQYSKTIAAIAATMPINIPLGMWIVGVGGDTRPGALVEFNEAVLVNIFPTVAFILVAWLMARAGHAVLPTIAVGYVVWARGPGDRPVDPFSGR